MITPIFFPSMQPFPYHTSTPSSTPYIPSHLKVILVHARNNDVINLQHHPAKLRRKLQLLLLPNERVNDKRILHVVVALAHAVDAEPAPGLGPRLHLLALDLGQRRDGVEPAVLRQRHGHGVERLREGPHGVLLQPGRLDRRVLDREGARHLGGAAAVDDTVVANEVPDDAEGVVEGSLRLVDDLGDVSLCIECSQ